MAKGMSSLGIRNIGLILIGIILLAIGLVASYYQVTHYLSPGPPPGGPIAGWQVGYPYRNIGIILLVVGIIFIALGLLFTLQKTQQQKAS